MAEFLPKADEPRSRDGADKEVGWHGHVSLRVKGLVSLLVFVGYLVIVGALVTADRDRLLALVEELREVHRRESQLVQVNMLVARTVLSANETVLAFGPEVASRQLQMDVPALERLIGSLSPLQHELQPHVVRLRTIGEQFRFAPTKESIALFRAELHTLVVDIDRLAQAVRTHRDSLIADYRHTHDKVALETFSFVLLGVVVFGALVTIFFARLTWDIRRVRARALAVVTGYRGPPLDVTRGDDVGVLMAAVNDMQYELRARERQLEMARQQQFYHEKMAAVGSLASAIAHEINNPIMAISGIAEAMAESQQGRSCAADEESPCRPDLILEQTRRIAQITRQMAEFSVPQPPEPALHDLNSLVANACSFIRFDKRYRRVDLRVTLDPQLPAVELVSDHFSQVLINLLVNAADAVENLEDRLPVVSVATRLVAGAVEVSVTDNGIGMEPQTLARAFDEYFTTKAAGRGTGLGLFLCRTLVGEAGGEIELDSTFGEGTSVTVRLPVIPPSN